MSRDTGRHTADATDTDDGIAVATAGDRPEDPDATDDDTPAVTFEDAPDGGGQAGEGGTAGPPPSYPPVATFVDGITRRRAVFSRSYAALGGTHITPRDPDAHAASMRRRRRIMRDGSLKLIDDLTNRSVDPLFEDSTLLSGRHLDRTTRFLYHTLSFLLCVAIGIGGCLAVQQLHKQTRQKVRDEYASQLSGLRAQATGLQEQVDKLNAQINALTAQSGQGSDEQNAIGRDAMANGTAAVEGAGLAVTLADPLSTTLQQPSTPHDGTTAGAQVRIVRDTDLQFVVSTLWRAGAEAIAINGERLGVQSAIRKAGQSILVGVDAVQSPYAVSAIGDARAMRAVLEAGDAKATLDGLRAVGISVDVSAKARITMDAASQPDLDYAKKGE